MTYVPTLIDYEGSDADRLPDMGEKVNQNFDDIESEFAAWMGAGVCGQFQYLATDFVGGTSGCLDNIDATDITDGEKAIVVIGTSYPRLYLYRMKSPDSTTESSPEVIAPDTGGTTKRWMLSGRTEHYVKAKGAAPTANDDVNNGYQLGDAWQYSDTIYFCIDNTASNAVWIPVPSAGTIAAHASNHEDGGSDEITLLKDDIKVAGAIDLLEISTPSNPTSGRDKLYPKTGGGFYKLDNSGVEKELIDEDVLDTSSGHDHDGANSKTVDHSDLANVTSDQHHAKSHTWEGGDHTGTLNESTVTFDNSTGHDHDGSNSTAVDHADLGNVTSDQHHAKSHTWEGGDHTGTLNESSVTFDNSTGHSHDGSDSTAVDHGDLSNVIANQHHNEDHASRHGNAGADPLDGDGIECSYSASNYTPASSTVGGHYSGIDTALGALGGSAIHDVVGGHAEVTSTTVITYVNVESNQITLFNDTTRELVTLASAPDFDSGTDLDLDSNSITADSVYDFFIEYSSGTAANLVCKKWTNTTTRAITPEEYGGQVVYDKDTAAGRKRRFLATVATDSSGYFQDAEDKRFLSNLYHTEHRRLRFANPYTSATSDTGVSTSWEQFNGGTSDWKVQFCYHGLNAEGLNVREHLVNMVACVHVAGASSWNCGVAIGYSTSSPIDGTVFYTDAIQGTCIISTLSDEPLAGLRTLYPLQEVESSGATFYFWTDNDSSQFQGTIEG